jgi:Etoposide-induced protein 2.4 (EI24)
MKLALDSFWRAAMYCLHPRVIALSILPLVIMVLISLGLGYFFWDQAMSLVRANLESWGLVQTMLGWLEGIGLGRLRSVLAPLVVLLLALPLMVIASLLFVAMLMTPAMVSLVGDRRFDKLEKKRGASVWMAALWSLGSTLVALTALILTVPLWFIPPLILVLPPLIWGWLTYRVMAFDALTDHASKDERRRIFKEHRGWLLGIGVVCGYLGAAPTVVWASGAIFIAMAPVLVPVAIWVYTLVFAFSSLWFAHYCLAALDRMRREDVLIERANAAPPVLLDIVVPSASPAASAEPPTFPKLID